MYAGTIRAFVPERNIGVELAEVIAVLCVVTGICYLLPLSYGVFGNIYLLVVILLSVRVSRWPVFLGAAMSALAWNFIFVPPRMSFSVLHLEDSLLLCAYFIVAMIGAHLGTLRLAAHREKLLFESDKLHRALFDHISHELKTPLSVLKSASEQLSTYRDERHLALLDEISQATQRLNSVFENLLNHSRLESGVLKPNADWCDAHDIINAAVRTVGGRIGGRRITIEIEREMPLLHTDAPMLEQSLVNLLLNAAVHTPASSQVWVKAGCRRKDAELYLSVADDGPGVPPEIVDVLFEKFQKGLGEHRGGLGLGLSIVRGFMSALGGRVEAENRPGGGTCFTLTLPWEKHDLIE